MTGNSYEGYPNAELGVLTTRIYVTISMLKLSQILRIMYGLYMWRVAANILNKQSRTADRGWSSTLGVL